jgi:hypothetical protein
VSALGGAWASWGEAEVGKRKGEGEVEGEER